MFEDMTGLAGIVMFFSVPLAALSFYTYYRVCKLRSEERMAAIARGVTSQMSPIFPKSRGPGVLEFCWFPEQSATSRRSLCWHASSLKCGRQPRSALSHWRWVRASLWIPHWSETTFAARSKESAHRL